MFAAAATKLLRPCLTLCDPIAGSSPGSAIPGILQARALEWVAISFSNARKLKVKVTSLSRVQHFATPWTAAHQALPSTGFSRQENWSGAPLLSQIWMFTVVFFHICQKLEPTNIFLSRSQTSTLTYPINEILLSS